MEEKRLYALRGAVCTENTADAITKDVGALYRRLFLDNALVAEDIVSVQFTVTPDLDALNPATALRRADTGLDVSSVPLFCAQEPVVKNLPPKVIRVMITAYMPCPSVPRHAYLNGADALRPDLCKDVPK